MTIIPIAIKEANVLVKQWHRHHKPVVGARFAIGVKQQRQLVGAAIVGRPVARMSHQTRFAEVTRLVTNGEKNACSVLYAACARIAKEMGFWRIQTFILESEPGTSLKAAGWRFDALTGGGDWNRPSRGGRRRDQPQERKQRWVKDFQPAKIERYLAQREAPLLSVKRHDNHTTLDRLGQTAIEASWGGTCGGLAHTTAR